jgi:hypothetical protein
MTEDPKFSPQRSAAIRQLLIDNVEAEPRRRRRHLRTLLAGLIITSVVASGTTALALNRDSLFGEPTPSATETGVVPTTTAPSVSPPTQAPEKPAPISVASSPIVPHDIDTASGGPGWSLRLPGLGEPGKLVGDIDISEDYALITVAPEHGADLTAESLPASTSSFSLTLVNTRTGEQVWSRDWHWDLGPGVASAETRALVLGKSGRVLVVTTGSENGPREVLDLTTGTAVAAFQPAGTGETLTQVYTAPGDSGDVYATFSQRGPQGDSLPYFLIKRFDPAQPSDPQWSTRIDAQWLSTDGDAANDFGYTRVTYSTTDSAPSLNGVLDLSTGEFSPRSEPFVYYPFTGYTIRTNPGAAGGPTILTGLDADGNAIWTRTEPGLAQLNEVLTSDAVPGSARWATAGTGQFLVVSADGLTLVDGPTGTTVWQAQLADWELEYPSVPLRLEAQGDTLTVTSFGSGTTSSRVDLATGARLAPAPWDISYAVSGVDNVYRSADGRVSAIEKISGNVLWTTELAADSLFYAGGRLVASSGDSLRSVG